MGDVALQDQAVTVLEWPRILGILAGHARSSIGAEYCRRLPLESTLADARLRMQETDEMVGLDETTDPFPSLSFPDLREVLGRVGKGAMMEGHELRDLSIVLGLSAEVIRYVERRRHELPALFAAAAPLEGLRASQPAAGLKWTIDRCIDAEGHIVESASPDLRRLMHHAQALKQSMRRRLDMILVSQRYADVLQEQYFAQREGRYVVPIKAEMRGKIPGIVHDVSASGATVFLEPRELVELNNAIKVADLEVDREVKRILQDLSLEVAGHVFTLLAGSDGLGMLDRIAAKAAFSRQVKGSAVVLNDCGRVMLRQARHPLLILAREQVVANDILLDESVRVLVISGPNTGGKTVTLKITGLFALMVRAGVRPPCSPDSEMAIFPEIYADIGDAQDLTKDLSSFSAHMTQMICLLDEATRKMPDTSLDAEDADVERQAARPTLRALVLLDEPVTSTDPVEGAALAEALLVRLADLGLKVIATTHYNSLKALAQTTPGFTNASVEFDVTRLAPTYRLLMGLPGGSSAIDIAGRLGMDERLLDHALSLLHREDRNLDQMLGELQAKQRRLTEDQLRAAELRVEAEKAVKEAAEVRDELQVTERERRRDVRKKLTDELLRARAQVQEVVEQLRGERTLVKAKEAKQRLAEIEEKTRTQFISQEEQVPLDRLDVGDRVEIVSLGTSGVLLEPPRGKKRVRVRVGEAEMSVSAALLVGRSDQSNERKARIVQGWPVPNRPGVSVIGGSADLPEILDLRGKTAEEALEETIAMLDRAALAGAPSLRIIHGHGTGRLKTVLREYLSESPYVANFRSGERAEGGDGVTIAELR